MYAVWHQLTGLKPKAEHFGLCYALAFIGEGGGLDPNPGILLTHQAKPAPCNKHFLDDFICSIATFRSYWMQYLVILRVKGIT